MDLLVAEPVLSQRLEDLCKVLVLWMTTEVSFILICQAGKDTRVMTLLTHSPLINTRPMRGGSSMLSPNYLNCSKVSASVHCCVLFWLLPCVVVGGRGHCKDCLSAQDSVSTTSNYREHKRYTHWSHVYISISALVTETWKRSFIMR